MPGRVAAVADRYMMATAAMHPVGDISRDQPSLAIIYGEEREDWIGEWATGIGFINVHFPKATTRELTDDEKAYYGSRFIEVAGRVRPIDIACCDMHNQHCEAPSELCCVRCTEAAHVGLFPHSDGSACVLDRQAADG